MEEKEKKEAGDDGWFVVLFGGGVGAGGGGGSGGFPGRFQERRGSFTQSFLHRYTSPTTSSSVTGFPYGGIPYV